MLWFYLGALITCIAFMVLSIIFITRAIRHNKKVLLDICAQKQGECQTYHGFIHWLSQKNALFLATAAFAVSAFIYLLPVVCTTPELSNGCEGITIFFVVVHNVLKLFVVDSDFSLVVNALAGQSFDLWFRIIYSFFGWIFFIGAPVFTAVSLISFVKDAFAMRSIKHHKPTNVYIFTELNFMSLSVVKSIVKKYIEDDGKRPLIVFANVYKSETEESRELIVKAEELGARCVSKDLVEIELDWFEKDDEVKLYCLGVNQDENMNQALKLVDRYHELFAKSNYDGYVKKPEIYVYTSTAESEALLDKIDKEHLHVRRINENRNLVFATLKEHSIFDDVDKENEGKEIKGDKQMNVAIIGLGGYGMELLKTLSWLGQAKGYYLNAFVFDGEDGREKLRAVAPDMLRYNYLGVLDKDEDAGAKGRKLEQITEKDASYSIHFYNKIDVKTAAFLDKISEINKKTGLTSIYVTLGNDSLNVQTAMAIRRKLARETGSIDDPKLYAVVFDTTKTELLQKADIKDVNGKIDFKITYIGNLEQAFSQETVEQKEVEREGLEFHKCWANINDPSSVEKSIGEYESAEYFRRSSMAQALFYELSYDKIVYENVDEFAMYEHNRWNAFMRADGFVACKTGEEKDNFVRKTHHNLVEFQKLDRYDQKKDFHFLIENNKVKVKDKSKLKKQTNNNDQA